MPTYVFRFKGIRFNTDDGDGEDLSTSNLLNNRYGKMTLTVDARNPDDALALAIEELKLASGFDVIDADYDLTLT